MKQIIAALATQLGKSKKFRKAWLAAVLALTTVIGQALVAGTLTGGVALGAIGAALLAGAAVYRVPNKQD